MHSGILIREMPQISEKPLNHFFWYLWGLLGCGLGVALGIGAGMLDSIVLPRFLSGEQVTGMLKMPVLAEIPREKKKKLEDTQALVKVLGNFGVVLQSGSAEKSLIVVTGENCGYTGILLGTALAQKDRRILLVDGDLLHQEIGEFYSGLRRYSFLDCMNHPEIPVMEQIRDLPGTGLACLCGFPAKGPVSSLWERTGRPGASEFVPSF